MRFDLSQSGLKSVITAGIFSLVAIGVLLNWAVPVSAQNSAPAKPDTPTLRALHQGMVEVDWNDVSGANRYEVQFYTSSGWIDLPNAGLGIEIFFDGSRAVATGLPEDLGYDAFHVRAGNSVGWSEWSEYAWQMTTHNMDWEGIPVPTIEPTPEPVNTPATGAPTIGGTAQVGEELTASTSGIADADGLTNVSYGYQWIRNDGTSDIDITGATDSSYTLVAADEGQTIKVKVSFTDDAENDERLTSAATGEVEARPNRSATGAPTISGTAQVGETLTADTSGIADLDGLTNVSYGYQWVRNDGNSDTDITDATDSSYTLVAADEGQTIKVEVSFADDADNDETLTSAATGEVVARPNGPATGAPTISGTAQVGETLTASTSDIADADGLTNVSYGYQWIANDGTSDTDITGATDSSYTLAAADEGQIIKVKVSFTDDADNDETLTSAATGEVVARPNSPATGAPTISGTAQVGETLTASTLGIADPDGLTNVSYGYQWIANDGTSDTDITGATDSTYTLVSADKGKTIKVLVTFTDDAGNGETLTSTATEAVSFAVQQQTANTPATGAPTISGTAQVGETLTANTSSILDDDGLTNVTFTYRWIANEGSSDTDITGATESAYTLVSADVGKTLKVRVTFTDDAGHDETLTSASTAAVAAEDPQSQEPPAEPTGLTATVSHDSVSLTWDDPGDESITGYQILRRDRALHAIGEFLVHVDDTGNANTTFTDNDVEPSVQYVYRIKAKNNAGLSELSEWVRANMPAPTRDPNSPATGVPTVTGTAQVGEVLTADTSGIADADGLENATFSYQWIRNDGSTETDIQDATGSIYTLVDADEGQTIKVKVSFTDDAGNEETLTSTATGSVAARPNTSATGRPTISGTARVGETLTASTSGIADSDGLGNAAFSYQWIANDGSTDWYIQDATGGTHALVDADEGKTVKVKVIFTDDAGNEETLTSAATATVAARPNSAATGALTISGMAQVGEELTANTSDIADTDGLTNVAYSYQWIANDGTSDTDITGATDSTYTLVVAEEGKTIKVKVSFTDDAGNEETLTSSETSEVAAAAPTEPPGIPRNLTGTANADGTVTLRWNDPNDDSVTGYQIMRRSPTQGEKKLLVYVNDTGSAATEYTDTNVVPNELYAYRVKAINAVGLSIRSEFINVTTTQPAQPAQNNPATGAPTITGTANVGQTLTADTAGIADTDGLTNVSYSYQWIRNDGTSDTDITGATDSAYTLVAADDGKTIKVESSFTDDDGYEESLTSEATEAVSFAVQQQTANNPATGEPVITGTANVGETLTADTFGIADADGLENATFTYQWTANDGSSDTDIPDATGYTYTLVADDVGKTIKVRVTFKDDAGNETTLTSAATDEVDFAVQQQTANSPATGEPTISGTAQVGEKLTVDTSGIADDDGLDNVSYSYQWVANDGSADMDITGATDSSHTLLAADESQTIKVRVSFTDDADNEETLTSAPTAMVAARPNQPTTGAPAIGGVIQVGETLTADTTGIADADGLDNATFGYQWLRNDGTDDSEITGATGSLYTLVDDDAGNTVKVRVSFTDDDGNDESLTSAATDTVSSAVQQLTIDHPPMGLPTIRGTARTGETLTVETTDITDGNSLTNAQFAYQWLRAVGGNDTEIPDATGSTYTLVDDDAGNAIKVRVSFTDDDGNGLSLTSDATDTILLSAAQGTSVSEPSDGDLPGNTTTTGVVAIGGTVSGIVDEGHDVDWFAVELTAGAYYKFSLHGQAMANSQVTIRGIADGNSSYVTPGPGSHRGSALHWKTSRSGTFYVDVGPFQGNRHGAYTLSASLIETAADAIPANTTTEAQVAVGGSRLYAIQTGNDRDWIKVDFEEGVRYRVLLQVIIQPGRRGWADMFYPALVHLRDPDGDPIPNTSNVYYTGIGLPAWYLLDSAETYYRAAEDGIHYIVAGSSVNTTGIFKVQVFQTMDDDYSAGTSTTGTVTVDGGAVGGKIEVPGDKDWFKVSLTSGETYRVDVLGSYANGGDLRWPKLTGIYNSSGARFANTQNWDHGIGSNPRKYFTASQAGDHFIGVAGHPFGIYEVSVEEVDTDLPADNTTTASLTVDGKVYGEIDQVNEEDWYELVLEADKAYTIKVDKRGDRGASDMRIKNLYDADGDVISDLGGGHRKPPKYYDYQWYFEPAAAGTYYVSVDNPSYPDGAGDYLGTPTGPYWIEVKEVPFDVPADTTSPAAATLNGRYTGVFEIKRDQDWYTFTGTAGKGYVVAGVPYWYVPPGRSYDWGVPIVGIYDSSGTKLPNTSDLWYNGGVYFEPSSNGTYYVALKGSYLYPVTTYHLDLYETELDQPADPSTTATVSVGGTYSGWIQGLPGPRYPDRDWIKMTLVANEEYAIHMRGMPTGDGTLESPVIDGIFDSSGTGIAGTTDGEKGQNAQVNFTPAADGDYYINAGWHSLNYESPIFGSYTVEVVDVDGDGQ